MNAPMSDILENSELVNLMPNFFQLVFKTPVGDSLALTFEREITHEDFTKFLEYCYCDKVLSPITGNQAQTLKNICS
jgi:hypothetical protein